MDFGPWGGGMNRDEIARNLDERVTAVGYELVALEWAGSRSRPILRVRVDLPDSLPGQGVTVDDCAVVSRDLEAWLEERGDTPERYVLEVSSPGVDRPLVRPRDWTRFSGSRIAVTGREVLLDGARRIEGELLGTDDSGAEARIRMADGTEVSVALDRVKHAHVVYDWDANNRGGE